MFSRYAVAIGVCFFFLLLSSVACAGPGNSARTAGAAVTGSGTVKPPGIFTLGGEIDASSGKVPMQSLDTMKFTPNSLVKTRPNATIEIELTNAGATVHNIVAPGMGLATAVNVNPRQKVTAILKAPGAAGTYPFWCNVPGHAEAGMIGQVVVSE